MECFLFPRFSPPGDRWCGILAFCLQEVSQAPQHLNHFAHHSIFSIISLHSGMPRTVHLQETQLLKIDIEYGHLPVMTDRSTIHFG